MKRLALGASLLVACATDSGDPLLGESSSGGDPTSHETTDTGPDESSGTTDAGSTAVDDGSTGSESTGGEACSPTPDTCPELDSAIRAEVTATDASPYFIRPPADALTPTDVVLFMPGGPGSRDLASLSFDLWLGPEGSVTPLADELFIVVPYASDGNLPDEPEHVLAVLDEVLGCHCTSGRVHLGGTSMGGQLAYSLALDEPERFDTLLGAPGAFTNPDPGTLAGALAGKAVFNAIGELDGGWRPQVEATHEALLEAGIDSTLFEMPGQDHILTPEFDESVFFEFWTSH